MDHNSQPKSYRFAGDLRVCRLQHSKARRDVGYQEDLCHWSQPREYQHSVGACILAQCATVCHWVYLVGGRLSRDCRRAFAVHNSEHSSRGLFAKRVPAKCWLPLFGCSKRYRWLCSCSYDKYLYHIRRRHPARNHQPNKRATWCCQSPNPRSVLHGLASY